MKTHPAISSSRRKARKAHFSAPSHLKYRLMSAALNKDLRKKHEIKSLPVRKDDEVQIMNGTWKGQKGKVTQVYRLRNCLYIEKISKNKLNGQSIRIPIHPSNVRITNIKMTKDRQNLIDRKRAGRGDGKNKGKYTAQDVN